MNDHIEDLFVDFPKTDLKTCTRCKETKPLSSFGTGSKGPKSNSLLSHCKACQGKSNLGAKLSKRNAPPRPQDDSGYKCPICDKDVTQIGRRRSNGLGTWIGDHDHKTGKFRAWICDSCNKGIGYSGDRPDILRKQADYLESHK